MTAHEFFDTNILLYSQVNEDPAKKAAAQSLLADKILYGEPYISVQVSNEFAVNALRKGKALPEVQEIVEQFLESFHVLSITKHTALDAFRLSRRYQFSFWDSLIVASALEARCTTLYTEDLQDGQLVDGILVIRNPFRVKEDNPQ
jgi:predicted nucleic acid-binding protein